MKRDGRLSGVLHVMLHMAEVRRPLTSETMARAMGTNAVVIRRIMAGLRDAGLVRSGKGHGGGWTIERDLAAITLADVYRALGSPGLFAIGHRSDMPGCLVEEAVNATLGQALRDAETVLLDRFARVTLAELSADFHARMVAGGKSFDSIDVGAAHAA